MDCEHDEFRGSIFVFTCFRMEEHVWVVTGPIGYCGTIQMSIHHPDTQRVIPEEMASLLDWIKAIVRSLYPDKGYC